MIYSEPDLILIAEILRQAGEDYNKGKKKIESLKKKFVETKIKMKGVNKASKEYRKLYNFAYKMLTEIDNFFSLEEFWFGDDCGVDKYWEKKKLNLLGWDVEYFKRMVREGRINRKGDINDCIQREEPERKRILEHSGDRAGHVRSGSTRGSDERRTFRTSSGDCSVSVGEATKYVGCVC
jgi:hypothetical protein